MENPPNLGEARHLLASQNDVYYWLAYALVSSGNEKEAHAWWRKASRATGDLSEATYYSALSLRRLGEEARANSLLEELLAFSRKLARQEARIDYFATSLPTMLLFQDDLQQRQKTRASFLRAQALLGLGQRKQAGALLRRILERDPSHPLAFDLIAESDCATRLRQFDTVEV